ncbi:MAG: delta 1-pyrroline-5-carboxylate reductase [Alyxoria varia]|nr:MAG: delta 1-pyrroline-5-carboxylate reductase [Alyxoria varia]
MSAPGHENSGAATGEDKSLTMTVLGCGTMGIAILSGILASLDEIHNNPPSSPAPASASSGGGTTTDDVELPPQLPRRFLACIRRPESAKRIENELAPYTSKYQQDTKSAPFTVETLIGKNFDAIDRADIILLACKPYMFRDILAPEDPDYPAKNLREILTGKLLISILPGVSVPQIEEHIYGSHSTRDPIAENRCRIVQVMTNTCSRIREATTVIATPEPALSPPTQHLLTWIFTRIGLVTTLPASSFNASTALCGSGPAFVALVLEALADGGVAMGLPREAAQMMAAQTMRGTTGMVLGGEHPALLRDKVATPGGCTMGGLCVLEEGRVRGSVSRAVREAAVVAGELGKGRAGVNGTRWGGS